MDTTYYLFLLTFLCFPLIALVIAITLRINKPFLFLKIVGIVFLIHNVFFLLGFSLKGDYADYFIFSLEYLFFCFIIFSLFNSRNVYIKIFRVLATIAIASAFIIGIFGIFFFIFLTQDYETDKTFHFESNQKMFEARRYSFGGATLDNTKYTFETYIEYKNLPFEKKIDKTIFIDTESKVAVGENELKIVVETIGDKERIVFKDKEGDEFSKVLN